MEMGWPFFGNVRSVLDVGTGTGRSLGWLRQTNAALELFGLEPSPNMIELARRNLPTATVKQGIGEDIPYESKSIDVVIATGIMHHVDYPNRVIDEMFRVARKGVLISDHNNYAFGGPLAQRIRMGLKVCGLLKAATFIKQGFNSQGYSEEDGWWYPYSLFENYSQISNLSRKLFIFPTRRATGEGNILFSQSHFAIVALL
jgi:ubiquinone/menaquinone biosynthesis C-methylase UbiE